jgi:hypothetical protein
MNRKNLDKLSDNSHAFIFSGPEGSGKFEVALEFASKLNGNKKNEIDASSISADLTVLSPVIEEKSGVIKKRDIKVEHIRELIRKISLTSGKSLKKIAIIKNAEKLTISAQNAILKTLEEPPENSVIILVTNDKSRLLPTVISRCQRINFNLNPASNFLREGEIQVAKHISKIFSISVQGKMLLAEEWSKDISETIRRLDYWKIFLRKIILGLDNYRAVFSINPLRALLAEEEIEKSQRLLLETNANPKLVLENLFLKME